MTLSTADGPAFKPLPVAVCALLAPLGGRRAGGVGAARARAAAVAAVWAPARARLAAARRARGARWPRPACALRRLRARAARGAERARARARARRGGAWRDGRLRVGAALGRGVRAAARRGVAVPGPWRAWWRGGGAATCGRCCSPGGARARPRGSCPEWLGSGDVLRSGARARVPNPGQPALADVPALAAAAGGGRVAAWPLWFGVAARACATGGARLPRPPAAHGRARRR